MSTPDSDQPALLAIDGPVATLTLNRPDAFNSINLAIGQRLEQLALQVEADNNIRVLVIEGAGRAFCGGGDIQVFGASMNNLEPVIPRTAETLPCLHHRAAADAQGRHFQRPRFSGGRRPVARLHGGYVHRSR